MHFCASKIARTPTFDTAPALSFLVGKLRSAGGLVYLLEACCTSLSKPKLRSCNASPHMWAGMGIL